MTTPNDKSGGLQRRSIIFHVLRGSEDHPGWFPWAALSALFMLAGCGTRRGILAACLLSLAMLSMIVVSSYQISKERNK